MLKREQWSQRTAFSALLFCTTSLALLLVSFILLCYFTPNLGVEGPWCESSLASQCTGADAWGSILNHAVKWISSYCYYWVIATICPLMIEFARIKHFSSAISEHQQSCLATLLLNLPCASSPCCRHGPSDVEHWGCGGPKRPSVSFRWHNPWLMERQWMC